MEEEPDFADEGVDARLVARPAHVHHPLVRRAVGRLSLTHRDEPGNNTTHPSPPGQFTTQFFWCPRRRDTEN